MRQSSLIRVLRLLMRSESNKLALWDTAQPIALDELRVKFAALARNDVAFQPDQPTLDSGTLTMEELWKIFESLDELEDWPVIS